MNSRAGAAGPGLWLLASTLLALAQTGSAAEVEWLPSLEKAQAASRQSGKPIFAVFR